MKRHLSTLSFLSEEKIQAPRIALIGNPNAGKTTLFNALTGARQQVGNWPGVTVERKSGFFSYQKTDIEVVDLPGVYTLTHASNTAMDEAIAREYILSDQANLLVNVLDGSHLERHLYLTAQLIEMQVPMILVINMMDALEKQGYQLDVERLSQRLGCPVIPLKSHTGEGIETFKAKLMEHFEFMFQSSELATSQNKEATSVSLDRPAYPSDLNRVLQDSVNAMGNKRHAWYYAIRALEENALEEQWEEEPDILIASARYSWAHRMTCEILTQKNKPKNTFTPRLDRIVLNRLMGIPIFLGVIYLMFLLAIHVGGIFQDFFDQASDAIFVQGTAYGLERISAPSWLTAVLAAGVGKGINTTLTFIPVLWVMFFCLSFLEASGYMARAAFVMDRSMRALGLPGKSLVPMIVGFGCNVPAIMGARTLEDPRDRILTIIMSPFMSCSARLAIFSVFVAAFFPSGGQNIVFALYLIGIVMAILTGFILRKTLLQGEPSPWVMELPAYHWPTWKALFYPAMIRTQHFLVRAGKIIVPVCLLLGLLNGLNLDGSLGEGSEQSLLSVFGKALTPIFSPMGITEQNWPATVGLLTGTLAKEVVVATLNTLYAQAGHLTSVVDVSNHGLSQVTSWHLKEALIAAVMTIPEHIAGLSEAISHPILASVPESEISTGVYGEMVTRFAGSTSAFAYLLFVLLYIPCASTMAVIRKELNTRWMAFSIFWSTGLAYSLAVIFYQGATWAAHPLTSLSWFVVLILLYIGVLKAMANRGRRS